MCMLDTRTTFIDVVTAATKALFSQAEKEISGSLTYPSLGFQEGVISIPNEQRNQVSGPSAAALTEEGVEYAEVEKFRGYEIVVTPQKYTHKLSYTEEVVHWLQKASTMNMATNEIKNAASDAANALYQVVDQDATRIFYQGFSTTNSPVNKSGNVGNSEALYASHALRKPGVSAIKNTFATADGHLPLSSDALKKMIDIMNRFQSHAGIQLLPVKDLVLQVAVEGQAEAYRIVKSDYGPNSAQLGLNASSESSLATRGMKITIVEAPWIPSANSTHWGLIDRIRASKALQMGWGWRPRLDDDLRKTSGTFLSLGSVYFRPISLGWDYTAASKGDNTAS